MMLETSRRATTDAGADPDRLKASLNCASSGISDDRCRILVVNSEKPCEAVRSLYARGDTDFDVSSGRVSLVLDSMGPAKAVDAACASSLVSVHDLVANLQQGKAKPVAGSMQGIPIPPEA